MTAILAFAGIAGCGSDDEEAPAPPPAGESGEPLSEDGADATVEIVEFLYEPEDLTVTAGATVTWANSDKAPHTATADDGSFNTESISQDQEGEVTFDEPGTYAYFCEFHPFMKATVEVE